MSDPVTYDSVANFLSSTPEYMSSDKVASLLSGDITAYYNKPVIFQLDDRLVDYMIKRYRTTPKKKPVYPTFIAFFRNFTNIQEIVFSCNKNDILPDILACNLSKLESLTILTSSVTSLPESIGNLSQLKKLIIRYANLTSLPESIGNLTNLRSVLIEAQLTSLPESIGNLTNVQYLHLSHNKLTSLPESIGNLSHLIELVLVSNKLTTLPESIGNLSQLKYLVVNNNNISSLPESIGNLSQLKKLEIDIVNLIPEHLKQQMNSARRRVNRNGMVIRNAIENTNITNNMFALQMNKNVPKSYAFNSISIIKFYEFMQDIVHDILPIDRLAFNTYSYKGDYYVNKFLSTDIFSKNGMNQRTYDAFRNLPLFKKLMKRLVPNNEINKNVIENYKQELIYHLFVLTYNAIVHVNRMIKDKISKPFTVYRGSKTHYLKEDNTKFYYFNSFVSTSTNTNVAEEFANFDGPIYTFIIHPACYFSYLDVGMTRYPNESEVLLTPYHRYYFLFKTPANPYNNHPGYTYYVLPSDLDIPNTFETFLPWKDTVKDLFANTKNVVQTGGKGVMLNQITFPQFVNTRKNMGKNVQNTRKNMQKKLNMRNTRKNMQNMQNTRKNVIKNTNVSIQASTQKIDKERVEHWTEPLPTFAGKAPTQEELAMINKMKASLGIE